MDDKTIAWLAGLLEGEGCFRFSRTPHIILQMTDEDIIRRVAGLWNKHYRANLARTPNRKRVFTVEVFATDALAVMGQIFPYMGERRKAKIAEVRFAALARLGSTLT